tara:strand:+ start:19 stop:771 length:753 start_codon:yes stop_codon:yes gene_type:complete
MPKISVVMSAFNEENNIKNAILSIQNQTFKDWELIIVNDGSSDKTLDIIIKFSKLDNRIIVINNYENIGLAKSLNKAIYESNGQYIARMDADDFSLPKRLSIQLDFMEKNQDISVLGTGAIYIEIDGKKISDVTFPENHNDIVKSLLKSSPLLHPSVLIRRTFLDMLGGYDESYYRGQDYDLWLRGKRFGKYHNLQQPLIKYTDKEKFSFQSIRDSFKIRCKHANNPVELVILLFWFIVSVIKRIIRSFK